MIRVRFAIAFCLLLLAGCANVSSRQAFPKHYALAGAELPASHEPTATHMTLRIARIAVPSWLDGTDMYYRLDYRHDDSIAAYAQSDWLAPPAQMLEQVIRNTIAGGGTWRAVFGPDDPANADFSLRTRIDDFGQVFTSPQQSYGVLDAVATLVDNRDETAVAQKRFYLRVAAPGADAAGGVAALNSASRQFAVELQQWLQANIESRRSVDPPK